MSGKELGLFELLVSGVAEEEQAQELEEEVDDE